MSAGEPLRTEEAGMAELADAQASGACGSNIVRVQVPLPAFFLCRKMREASKPDTYTGFEASLFYALKAEGECRSNCCRHHPAGGIRVNYGVFSALR